MKENAKTRRHLRRVLNAIRRCSKEVAYIIEVPVDQRSKASSVKKRDHSLSQLSINRVRKAVDTQTEYNKQIVEAAAKYPDYRVNPQFMKVCNEAGRQIHAVQKRNKILKSK